MIKTSYFLSMMQLYFKAVDSARLLNVSTSPAGIKYKFGIQVSKGIKNAI
jgi:hypothetical protein